MEAKDQDLGTLRAIQDWFVRYQLNAVPGVAEVASIGGFVRQYQIDVDPNRLAAFGLSIRDVISAVEMSNNNVGGKVVEQGGMEYVVRGMGLIHDVSDVEKIVVASRGGTPVYVSSVGTVQIGPEFRRGALEKNGSEVVGGVTMRYGEAAGDLRGKEKDRRLSRASPLSQTSISRRSKYKPGRSDFKRRSSRDGLSRSRTSFLRPLRRSGFVTLPLACDLPPFS